MENEADKVRIAKKEGKRAEERESTKKKKDEV